jgi:hypothetical protein
MGKDSFCFWYAHVLGWMECGGERVNGKHQARKHGQVGGCVILPIWFTLVLLESRAICILCAQGNTTKNIWKGEFKEILYNQRKILHTISSLLTLLKQKRKRKSFTAARESRVKIESKSRGQKSSSEIESENRVGEIQAKIENCVKLESERRERKIMELSRKYGEKKKRVKIETENGDQK